MLCVMGDKEEKNDVDVGGESKLGSGEDDNLLGEHTRGNPWKWTHLIPK